MAKYYQWHIKGAQIGNNINYVEEISTLNDKIDVIMSLPSKLVPLDPSNVPLNYLIAQEKERVDVNFISRNNFNNSAYRSNFGNGTFPFQQ